MNDFNYLAASNGSGEAVRATVTAERPIGAASISVDALTNWPDKFIAQSGTVDAATKKFIPGTVTVFYGSRDFSSPTPALLIERYADGYADLGHQASQVIVLKQTTDWVNTVKQLLEEHSVPVGVRQEYFGTKATFDSSPYRHGWLFMEKNVAYPKATYQRLYDHIKAVDAASVKTDSGATFMFADKWFGITGVSLDGSQTEFNTLGKNGGHKALQAHTHSNGSLTAASAGAHTHGASGSYDFVGTSTGSGQWASLVAPGGSYGVRVLTNTSSSGAHTHNVTGTTTSTGGGDSQNLQPYLTLNHIIKT